MLRAQQQSSPINAAIVGQGAIGLLAASRLALAGQPAPLLLRTPQPSLAITFSSAQQDFALMLPTQVPASLSFLLVPVKAYAIVPALQQYLHLLSDDADIVLSHNGMGTLDAATALLKPKQKLWFASTTHGALKTGAYRLRNTGLGQTIVGPVNAAAKAAPLNTALFDMLDKALGPLQQTEQILPVLWRKLAINALINPLTALHQVKNGELAAPRFQAALAQLLDEFLQVAQLCGQSFERNDLTATVAAVIKNTAQNYSSMQQDVWLGRPDELDYITGFLLNEARAHGITLPAHQQLYRQLRANS